MEFFLSSECSGMADSRCNPLNLELMAMLNEYFLSVEYPCIQVFAIISRILSDEFLDGVQDEVYFNRKERYAGVRLIANYRKFVYCNTQKRMRIYAEHILASIKVIEKKMKSDEEKAAYNDIIFHATRICNEFLRKHGVEPISDGDTQ